MLGVNTIGYASYGSLPNNDLNDAPSVFESYVVSIGCNGNTANQPSGVTYAYVFHFGNKDSGIYFQLAVNDQKKCYYRIKWNTWSTWKEI